MHPEFQFAFAGRSHTALSPAPALTRSYSHGQDSGWVSSEFYPTAGCLLAMNNHVTQRHVTLNLILVLWATAQTDNSLEEQRYYRPNG